MEGSFRIPKKKQQGSSVIGMTSPLSRLQNDVTSTSHWARESVNGKKQNGSGHVNGRRESDSYRWRHRRASDSLCQEDKHPPSAKKKWGSGLSETPKPEEDEEESKKKVERETKGTSVRDSVVKQNGAEEERPEKRVKIPEGTSSSSVTDRKPAADLPSPRRKLHLSLKIHKRAKPSSSEPIVLSSDDEDEGADAVPCANSQLNRDPQTANQNSSSGGRLSSPAGILELPFSTLHFGTTTTRANGPITITEETICIPLKDSAGQCVSVSLVPSELKAYAVWNRDGCKLMEQQGSSSSILFLSLTDAQARLLRMELSSLHNNHMTGSPCPFVLVLLIGRLDDLQRASLASLMEMMALRSGRQSLGTPLSWAEGVKRLLCHPRGSHLVKMLEHKEGTNQNGTRNSSAVPVPSARQMSLRSHTRQQSLPRRLIQYPPPPSKGGIAVTTEDLECLRDGEFLNDVIIDFYLKYLHLERTDRDVADRSHIFSSFFYKQLTRKDNPSEVEAGGTAQYRRHQRVRTWTRNVDIFSKDFIFIPVNQEAHWYLVVICFPGLLQPEHVQWRTSPADKDKTKGTTKDGTSRAHELPDCTAFSCQKDTVTKRPCILIMDSLKLSCHYRIYTLLQEYLQVEWEVRRGTPRIFNGDSIQRSQCKVPLQDNSSDCGLYLLQYVESFLQNPVVHFDLPLRLERWFPRQQVRRKRAELRELVLQLYRRQGGGVGQSSS